MVCVRSVLKNACAVGHTKAGALPCFQRGDGFVLLFRGQPAERLAVSLRAMGVELDDAGPIEFLLVGIGAGERKIDVVQDSRHRSLPAGPAHPASTAR